MEIGAMVEAVNGARGKVLAIEGAMATVDYRKIGVKKNQPVTGLVVIEKEARVKVHRVPVEVISGGFNDFVDYLKRGSSDYRLFVVSPPSEADDARREYREWSGEELPEDCLRERLEAGMPREWFLIFDYDNAVGYPFPIFQSGTVGSGIYSGPPRAFLRENRVTMNYREAVADVVRDGVRARK